MIPTWFIFTISGVFILAVAEIAQKISLTQKEDIQAESNNFVVWMIQGILALIYFLLFDSSAEVNLTGSLLLGLLLLGPVYFWGGTFYYGSYKEGSVGISSVLATISTVITTFLGIILLGEQSTILKFTGIALVLSAIFILNYSKKEKLTKSNLLALAGGGLYGLAYTLDKTLVINLTPHFYHIVFAFSIGLFSLLFRSKVIFADLKKLRLSNLKIMFVSALTFFGFNKLVFLAYGSGGDVGSIDAINNSVIFLIILGEYMFLKERSKLVKKLIAGLIAFSGIVILALLN